MKEIECPHCGIMVEMKLMPYANGHIAICPKCRKVAYNGE